MYAVLISAFGWLLSYVIQPLLIRFIVFSAFFALISALAPMLLSLLPDFSGMSTVFQNLPQFAYYFLHLIALDYGLPLLLSAALVRFTIRRLPIIG